jgi:hypothetical protein
MPFKQGHSFGVRFSSDNQPEKNGYPKGVKNRGTIVKKILEMEVKLPQDAFDKLKVIYPSIEQQMTTEEMMTIIQTANAITKGDTSAYKALMDSAYGAPKQEVDGVTNNIFLSFDKQDEKIGDE